MAIKYPGLWYQQSKDERFKKAVFSGIEKYDLNHGQPGGRFSGDEHLSGKSPGQGSELCSIVEYMFSLEELYTIFGNNTLADRLELLAYNSLPGTTTPDLWAHQYDQQANQVAQTVIIQIFMVLCQTSAAVLQICIRDGQSSLRACGWQQMIMDWHL